MKDFYRKILSEVTPKQFMFLGGFAFLLVGVMIMRGDIDLHALRSKANNKILTYEEARAKVAGEFGNLNSGSDTMKSQLALVDPSGGDKGSVLGAVTGLNIADPLETLLPQKYLDSIKLVTTDDNSAESFKRYSERVVLIESQNGMMNILATLNTDDNEKLVGISGKAKNLVASMKSVEVPSELVEYHKLKMIYYVTLGQIGESLAGQSQFKLDDITKGLLSIMDRLGAIKLEIYNKHGLTL